MNVHPLNADRLRRRPLLYLWLALAMLLPAGLADAQKGEEDFEPFTGVVTGDDVYVRAGGSKKYYWITKLNKGDLVRVLDERFGWYLIDAPEETFSWISKQYVDAGPDGKTGTVTGNDVLVRAPSPAGPGRTKSYKSQTSLDTGAKVTIIGEAPGWYKIEPPAGARAYISDDYVRRASKAEVQAARSEAQAKAETAEAAEAAEAEARETAETAPEAGAAETPADGEAEAAPAPTTGDGPATVEAQPTEAGEAEAAETPAPTEPAEGAAVAGEPGEAPPESEGVGPAGAEEPAAADEAAEDAEPTGGRKVDAVLAAVEQRFAEVSRQPLIDQPVTPLLTEYRRLAGREALNAQQRGLVEMRIELLETRRDLQETLVELKARETELEAERAAEADDEAAAEPEPAKAEDYTAVGRLLASSLYTGERLPKLYRLVDPLSDMTIGYVEPSDEVDARRMLGRVVGIIGSSRYHPGLKLNLIKVDRIDALAAQR